MYPSLKKTYYNHCIHSLIHHSFYSAIPKQLKKLYCSKDLDLSKQAAKDTPPNRAGNCVLWVEGWRKRVFPALTFIVWWFIVKYNPQHHRIGHQNAESTNYTDANKPNLDVYPTTYSFSDTGFKYCNYYRRHFLVSSSSSLHLNVVLSTNRTQRVRTTNTFKPSMYSFMWSYTIYTRTKTYPVEHRVGHIFLLAYPENTRTKKEELAWISAREYTRQLIRLARG